MRWATVIMRRVVATGLLFSAAATPGCSCGDRGLLNGVVDGGRDEAAMGDGGRADASAPGDGRVADGPARDVASPEAAPAWDAGTCAEPAAWSSIDVGITAVRLLAGQPAPRWGATERLEVDVQLTSSCERPAGVTNLGSPSGTTDFVDLSATAWVPGNTGCLPDAPIATVIFPLAGRAQRYPHVVVTDHHSPGGGLRLTYDRNPISQAACDASTPPGPVAEGGDCATDCTCAVGLACVGYYSFVGEAWSCLAPCVDFRDCPANQACPRDVADGPELVCQQETGIDQCQPGTTDCPDGFLCTAADSGNFCLDERTLPAGPACACDAECPPGQHCTTVAGETRCQAWCDRDAVCPQPAGANVFVCGTPGVCVPLV
jgi:hypothetical protein